MTDAVRSPASSATFVQLSYARPGNIQRIVDTVLQARCCGRLILSNNNPDIDILDFIEPDPERFEILQQTERWGAVKRFSIAREAGGEFFLCIDDDLFLTVDQIDTLFDRLRAYPAVPHGIWGAKAEIGTAPTGQPVLKLERGVRRKDTEVRIINRAYAFTRLHLERFFALMGRLGIDDPRALGPADDILLSYCGEGRPRIHDLGALEDCPTSDRQGIALWREPGFAELRARLIVALSRIAGEIPPA